MRTMGLDIGTKYIGVAFSDELGLTAQGFMTLHRTRIKDDLDALATWMEEREVSTVVVGLPLNMDGSEGPSAQSARQFGEALSRRCGRPVEYWDERLSTAAAQRALLEADVSRQKRRQVVDQVAATLILQNWLDARALQAGREE